MTQIINEIGNTYFFLRVFARGKKNKRNNQYWWCHCHNCGNFKEIRGDSLRGGHTKSCGCLAREAAAKLCLELGKKNLIDLSGKTFGRLRVIRRHGENSSRGPRWVCQCECGETTIVDGNYLASGHTSSCGCLHEEVSGKIDMVGRRFGRLIVIDENPERDKHGEFRWNCVCDCGGVTVVMGSSLRRGNTKSCGCLAKEVTSERTRIDIIGQKFERLTVISEHPDRAGTSIQWVCECSCGNETVVTTACLLSGNTKSCGCLNSELASEHATRLNEIQWGENHPHWNPDLTDEEREANKTRTTLPEYREWRNKVFRRDNYTCQVCGQVGYDLEAHHVRNYADFPELRYKLENGITMCDECHREKDTGFHSIFGTKNNTKGQLWAYRIYRVN